ncbi:hypothetical protein U1Q18_046105 [Sarracenia purpurea var. burkii]
MNVTGTTCGSDNVSFSDHAKSRAMLKTIHYKYDNFYPVKSDTNDDISLNFRVKAYSNAHILFSSTNSPHEGMPVYEIVLGVDHNKNCCIRRQQSGEAVTHVEYANMVSGDEWRSFWLRVSSKGLIEIGHQANDLPFMMWQDTNPLNIRYFSFSSWENTVALWSWSFDSSFSEDKKNFDVFEWHRLEDMWIK